MELAEKQLGPEAKLDFKLEGGKLVLSVALDSKGLDGKLELSLSPEYFAEKLKASIPGGIDDAIINLLLGVLKAA